MSRPIGVTLTGDNWFHTGWIRGILGLPKAEFYDEDDPILDIDIDAFDEGYDMGCETPNDLRLIFKQMIERKQILVK
jgi:hypothetical protein